MQVGMQRWAGQAGAEKTEAAFIHSLACILHSFLKGTQSAAPWHALRRCKTSFNS
jgi:hypothetical protein